MKLFFALIAERDDVLAGENRAEVDAHRTEFYTRCDEAFGRKRNRWFRLSSKTRVFLALCGDMKTENSLGSFNTTVLERWDRHFSLPISETAVPKFRLSSCLVLRYEVQAKFGDACCLIWPPVRPLRFKHAAIRFYFARQSAAWLSKHLTFISTPRSLQSKWRWFPEA